MLANDSATLEDILEQQFSYRIFKIPFPELTQFFISHIRAILNYALVDLDHPLSCKSYLILDNMNEATYKALTSTNLLQNVANKLINQKSVASLSINRLASISESILLQYDSIFGKSCGYLFQLLHYIYIPSVYFLFEALVKKETTSKQISTQLTQLSFHFVMLEQLESYSKLSPEVANDDQLTSIINLCHIMRHACRNQFLAVYFRTPQFFSTVVKFIYNWPVDILNVSWMVLTSLFSKATVEMMVGLLPPILELLIEPTNTISRYQVTALNILTKLMQTHSVVPYLVVEAKVDQVILRLIYQYSRHTFLQLAVYNFVCAGLLAQHSVDYFLSTLFPALIQEMEERTDKSITMLAYRIFLWTYKQMKCSPELKQAIKSNLIVDSYFSKSFRKFDRFIKAGYGGTIEHLHGDMFERSAFFK